MNPTTRKQSSSKITIDTPELMQMLTCGRVTAVEVGTRAGARIKIGKRVLWNVGKIQAYLDSISGGDEGEIL